MVRFIMSPKSFNFFLKYLFTFQYGQIYYLLLCYRIDLDSIIYIPIWLDLLSSCKYSFFKRSNYLHSNMVRFIIYRLPIPLLTNRKFTFQYGQIYYQQILTHYRLKLHIYIPIWLDLLLYNFLALYSYQAKFTFQYGQIYYSYPLKLFRCRQTHLHSNMVRFIICYFFFAC